MNRSQLCALGIVLLPLIWQSNAQEYASEANHERITFDFGAGNPLTLPAVGTTYLKILSSDILELVRISSDTTTWNFATTLPNASDFLVKRTRNGTVVNGTIQQIGFKRRPLYAPLRQNDLRIENTLYFKLSVNFLDDDDRVEVIGQATHTPASLIFIATKDPNRYSPVIHVNQEGYLTGSQYPKKAMIRYYLGSLTEVAGYPGEMNIGSGLAFQIIKTSTGETVHSGSISTTFRPEPELVPGNPETPGWPIGEAQYQRVREADFTPFNTPGEYVMRVAGLGVSFPFRIDDNLPMKIARTYALGLYHQRCGGNNSANIAEQGNKLPFTRFEHEPCHTALVSVPSVASEEPDDPSHFPSADSVKFIERTLRGYSGAFDFQLLSINNVSEIPVEDPDPSLTPRLVIFLAQLNQGNPATDPLYFRIFDEGGIRIRDKAESDYTGNAPKMALIAALKMNLLTLWSHASNLSGDQKRLRGDDVRAIVDLAATGSPQDPPAQAQRMQTLSTVLPLFQSPNAGMQIDVSKGHHDAGDYSKYTINSAQLVHILTFAADNFYGDYGAVSDFDNLGIPESGDGISDILQLAKWEADFLIKMQDSDGGFYFLVYPETREYEDDRLPENGDRQIVFPKTSSVTAAAVAALAEIGSSPKFRDAYPMEADAYLAAAQSGWDFLMTAISTYGKDGAYQKITHYGNEFGHDDELAWAAAALFVATGDSQYDDQLRTTGWLPDPNAPSTRRFTWWRMWEGYGGAIRDYAFAVRSGRLSSDYFDNFPDRAEYMSKCEDEIKEWAADVIGWSSASNAYRTSFDTFSKKLYVATFYFSSFWAFDLAVSDQIESVAPPPGP